MGKGTMENKESYNKINVKSSINNSFENEKIAKKTISSSISEISSSDYLKVKKLVQLLSPIKGNAVILLGEKLYRDNPKAGKLESSLLAADLLAYKEDSYCNTLSTLLSDGWAGTLGELLDCAGTL